MTRWNPGDRERLHRRFNRLPQLAREHIMGAMEQGAGEVTAMQKRLAPRDDGDLIRSIQWVWRQSKTALLSIKISAGDNTGKPPTRTYAHLVEFGTAPHKIGGRFKGAMHPGTKPRPFFYGPWRALRKRVKARLRRALKAAIIASKSS